MVVQSVARNITNALENNGCEVISTSINNTNAGSVICESINDGIDIIYTLNPTALLIDTGNNIKLFSRITTTMFVHMLDSPIYFINTPGFIEMTRANNIVFVAPDSEWLSFLHKYCGVKLTRLLFIPFGAPINSETISGQQKWDFVFFGTLDKTLAKISFNPSVFRDKPYAKALGLGYFYDLLNTSVNSDIGASYQFWQQKLLDINPSNSIAALCEIDSYLKALKRWTIAKQLLRLKDCKVCFIGGGWEEAFGGTHNFTFINSAPYDDQFKIFQLSKVVINCDPNFVFGIHDRVYNALMVKSRIITNNNIYSRHLRESGYIIGLYSADGSDFLDSSIDTLNFKDSDLEYNQILALTYDTWDSRMSKLLAYNKLLQDKHIL